MDQNMCSWRNSELDRHAEAGRLQGIADNCYDSPPASTEHRATYGGGATYNHPSYHLSYSEQPPNSITGSPLHQQIAQHAIGSSTTWQSPCDVHPNYPFTYYTPALGPGSSGARLADTPPIAYPQPSNYNSHYQAPGGPYSERVADDRLEHDASHLIDSSTAHTQSVHHGTHPQTQSLEGLYFGCVANDRPADLSPIARARPIHYGTHRQTPGGPDFGHVVGGGFAPHIPHAADSSFIAHTVSTLSLRHPSPDLSPGGPEFGHVVDNGFTPYALHSADSLIARTQPIHYDAHPQIQSPVGPDSRRVGDNGFTFYTPHPADPPPIGHTQPVHYDVYPQIQSSGWPYLSHTVNEEFEPDVHPANPPPITSTLLVHHDMFQLPEEPYFGPGVDDEFEPDLYPTNPPLITLTQLVHRDVFRLPEEPYFGPGVGNGFEPDLHPANPPLITPVQLVHRDIFQLPEEPHFRPGVGNEFELDLHPANPPHITPTQLVRHDVFRLPEEPYFGPGVNNEFEPDLYPTNPPFITPTQLVHHVFRLPEEPYFEPGVNGELEAETHLANSTPLTDIVHHQPLAEVGLAVGGSNSDVSRHPYICMWEYNGYGLCDPITAEGVAQHMATFHLMRGETHCVCQWRGCRRSKPYRRDTICRHIREVHLGEERR